MMVYKKNIVFLGLAVALVLPVFMALVSASVFSAEQVFPIPPPPPSDSGSGSGGVFANNYLAPGWNFISTPIADVPVKVDASLCGTDLGAAIPSIYHYNPAIGEYSAIKSLSEMIPGLGYWVYLDAGIGCEIKFTGSKVVTLANLGEKSDGKLSAGWNQIGGTDSPVKLNPAVLDDEAKSNRGDCDIRMIYGYISKTGKYFPEEYIRPGSAYWVYVETIKKGCTLGSQAILPAEAGTWLYVLNGYTENNLLKQIMDSKSDLLVIDAYQATSDGTAPSVWFSSNDVLQLKKNHKIVLAYLSIGEAEDYRDYWQKSWKTSPPKWMGKVNPAWEGNIKVKYWDPDWQKIIFDYEDKILAQGFDGVYLDIIDAYEYWADETNGKQTYGENEFLTQDEAASRMISFVKAIRDRGRKANPYFLVFPQNSPELVNYPGYLEAMDGIGKETTWYSGYDERATPPVLKAVLSEDAVAIANLKKIKAAGKIVGVLDYFPPNQKAEASDFIAKAKALGFNYYAADKRALNAVSTFFVSGVYIPSCIVEGKTGRAVDNEACCSGLQLLSNQVVQTDASGNVLCVQPSDTSFVCVKACGDGACTAGENACNCKADCSGSQTGGGKVECVDSDNGKEYYKAGTATGYGKDKGELKLQDFCSSANSQILNEHYCGAQFNEVNPTLAYGTNYLCPNGCEAGACKGAVAECTEGWYCNGDQRVKFSSKCEFVEAEAPCSKGCKDGACLTGTTSQPSCTGTLKEVWKEKVAPTDTAEQWNVKTSASNIDFSDGVLKLSSTTTQPQGESPTYTIPIKKSEGANYGATCTAVGRKLVYDTYAFDLAPNVYKVTMYVNNVDDMFYYGKTTISGKIVNPAIGTLNGNKIVFPENYCPGLASGSQCMHRCQGKYDCLGSNGRAGGIENIHQLYTSDLTPYVSLDPGKNTLVMGAQDWCSFGNDVGSTGYDITLTVYRTVTTPPPIRTYATSGVYTSAVVGADNLVSFDKLVLRGEKIPAGTDLSYRFMPVDSKGNSLGGLSAVYKSSGGSIDLTKVAEIKDAKYILIQISMLGDSKNSPSLDGIELGYTTKTLLCDGVEVKVSVPEATIVSKPDITYKSDVQATISWNLNDNSVSQGFSYGPDSAANKYRFSAKNSIVVGKDQKYPADPGVMYYYRIEQLDIDNKPVKALYSSTFSIPISKCSDGTILGECSASSKGKVCSGTTTPYLTDDCKKCGCPAGPYDCKTTVIDGFAGPVYINKCVLNACIDGTKASQCSAVTKSKYCEQSKCEGCFSLIDKCVTCGCPTGLVCENNICVKKATEPQQCSDGTPYSQCSITKPQKCENGQLINKCSECGCPDRYSCSALKGECLPCSGIGGWGGGVKC